MGLEIPDELKPVAALVVAKWPETDETGLRAQADRWDEMAELLEQLSELGDDVVKVVLAHTAGDTHDAIDAFWKKAGGADGALPQLAQFCRELAFVLRVMAFLVLGVKLYIISMLVYLAVQLAIAAALAVETLGASVAEGAAVQVAVRTMITTALRELIQQIGVRTIVQGALLGAGIKAGTEVGFQSLEIKLGIRDGYDGSSIASQGITGAISGAVAAPVTKLLNDKGVNLTNSGSVGKSVTNYLIGKKVGSTVSELTWGDQEGITDRVKKDVGDYVRKEIVEELSETPNTQTTGQPQSSLDLPPP
ncbi:hypothetical protein [Nocardia sp. NPDC052112]|uniref:WXG100-like domain-containing protein n=1 Tax=Nocardia sp. NPDC052112 TaxID=3155646 RepID=UPI00341765AB